MPEYDTQRTHELITGQRRFFADVMAARPLAPDVRLRDTELGGVPALEVTISGRATRGTIIWLHGGAFVAGSPRTALGPAANLARASAARVLSIDYRLAPEHPYPAAVDDALTAYRAVLDAGGVDDLIIGGESAGGALAVALLVAARDAELPPARAALMFSPVTDLTMAGPSYLSKADIDPVVTREAIGAGYFAYAAGVEPDRPALSPSVRRPTRPAAATHPGRLPRAVAGRLDPTRRPRRGS